MKMLFGGLLLATGGLIALLSGLCSAWFAIMLVTSGSGGEVLSMLPLMAVFGGVPFVIGFGLFAWGRALIRSAREEDAMR